MPPNWESSSAVFVCKRKAFAQHLGVLGRHCVHFANGGILFKDHLAVACGEDLQRVAAADALGAAGSRCGKWMHIFSFRAVRACILWAKHWTAPAAAAASNCTGPSAAGSRHGGTPPAVFSGSGKNSCAEMRNTRSLPASCSTACGIPAPLASRLKGTKGSFHIIENGRLLHPSVQQAAVLSFTVLR